MSLSQLGVDVVVLAIAVLALFTGGVNTPETPTLTDDTDRNIGVNMTEPDVDDTPPENSDPGAEQEPVIADNGGTDDSSDGGTANESGSRDGAFEAVGTGDDDADSPTRATKPRGNPVGVPDYNDDDGDDGSSDDSSSDGSAGDSPTDDSIDDVSSGDSTDDTGGDTGDDSGNSSSGGDSGDDIGMRTV